MSAAQFRKKPVVVEAMQWDGSMDSQRTIVTWAGGTVQGFFGDTGLRSNSKPVDDYFLAVSTLYGETRALRGDWVIRGPGGDFWPCKPDIFEATYEPVSPSEEEAR